MDSPPEFTELLRALTTPSGFDVVHAKRVILEVLSDGQVHQRKELRCVVAQRSGLRPPYERPNEKLHLPSWGEATQVVTVDHPLVKWHRCELATIEGIADLESQGLIVPAGGLPMADDATRSIEVNLGGRRSGDVRWERHVPATSDVYRIPYRLLDRQPFPFDADIFTSDLKGLGLDPRAERCLQEALMAFRHGLYLASASLLGAASEGSWFAAGERLRGRSSALDRAVDAEVPKVEQVQREVANVLRNGIRWGRSVTEELTTQAAYLRRLRNYGVHPGGHPDPHIEAVFEESACGVLLLTTHQYLARLAGSVAEIVDGA